MNRFMGAVAIGSLLLVGCQGLPATPERQTYSTTNPYDGLGCSPQLQAAYRLQATLPSATLRLQVRDKAGAPVPGALLGLSWAGDPKWVSTGPIAGCLPLMDVETNAEGKLVLERMKIGTYDVQLLQASRDYTTPLARATASVEAGQTVDITLIKP